MLIALVAIILLGGWLLTRKPSPEQVVARAAEAILRNDARTLWKLLHPLEKELLSEPQLRALLDAIHTEFPHLRHAQLPAPYYRVSLSEYTGDLVGSYFWQVDSQGRLTPLSPEALQSLIASSGRAYPEDPLVRPPTVVRLSIHFHWDSERVFVYAGSLVPFVAELSIATGRTVEDGMERTFRRAGVSKVLIGTITFIHTRKVRTVELAGGRKYFRIGR